MLFWIWIDNRLNLCVDLKLSLQSVKFWHPNSPNANFIPHVAVISTVAIWPVNDCTFLYLLVCLLVCFGHCQSSGWLPDPARFVPLLRKFLFYQPKSWISLICVVSLSRPWRWVGGPLMPVRGPWHTTEWWTASTSSGWATNQHTFVVFIFNIQC